MYFSLTRFSLAKNILNKNVYRFMIRYFGTSFNIRSNRSIICYYIAY